MDKEFDGKVALVTGGSTGIGRAGALAFARKGARVVVAARRGREGEETIALIRDSGGEAIFVQADVARASEVRDMVAKAASTYGRLDFAFNNAGIEGTAFVPTADYTEETWDQVISINLTGVWLSMKYEIPHILKQKGAIVNMSSVAGLIGGPIGAGYHASKHGVVGLTRTAAIEYAAQGLRVNAVCPAVIITPMAERLFTDDPEAKQRVTALHPLGRVGRPEEVADAVVWLCSEHASFITGHALPIDGGMVAQ
ncbi:MAG TPA: SDR family oxidoreductase [Acidobacteriota bacterium]